MDAFQVWLSLNLCTDYWPGKPEATLLACRDVFEAKFRVMWPECASDICKMNELIIMASEASP